MSIKNTEERKRVKGSFIVEEIRKGVGEFRNLIIEDILCLTNIKIIEQPLIFENNEFLDKIIFGTDTFSSEYVILKNSFIFKHNMCKESAFFEGIETNGLIYFSSNIIKNHLSFKRLKKSGKQRAEFSGSYSNSCIFDKNEFFSDCVIKMNTNSELQLFNSKFINRLEISENNISQLQIMDCEFNNVYCDGPALAQQFLLYKQGIVIDTKTARKMLPTK